RERLDEIVDFDSLDVAFEYQAAGHVVFPKQRHACLKYKEEATGRVNQRQPAVESQMELRIILVSSVTEIPKGAIGSSVQLIFRNQPACIGQRHEDRVAGVLERSDAIHDEIIN